ncbi:MAG: CspA family cold shock protein [Acidimicrobiales bacterium]|jgi:CspA family cold shock protein
MTGTIVKIVDDRGFGFIKPAEGEKELFFHAQSVVGDTVFDELKENDAVTFEIEDGQKGPAAVDVEKAA